MQPVDQFRFCPKCGAAATAAGKNPFECSACGFALFFNPTVAAAAFVFDGDGRALFIRRAREPQKGMLTAPGGFLDIGEAAEAGLRRELREEVGLEIDRVAFLCSEPNEYPYRGVTYPVCDLIFTAAAVDPGRATPRSEVAGIEWRPVRGVDPGEIAFPSVRKGLRLLQASENSRDEPGRSR